MNHLSEEQLVLHYYGEDVMAGEEAAVMESHLAECSQCRGAYNSLRLVLNTVDAAPVPERGPDYGRQIWRRIEAKTRRRVWTSWLQPRWWALVPETALMLVLAFFAGRISKQPGQPSVAGNQVRERILLVAVGDHLDRSQMVLAELSNAQDGKGKIDISDERQLAEDLLDDNRLYRQTAHRAGDNDVASVLDELERVLLEIAHGPSQVTDKQLEQMRQEIRDRGLLFKVRVIGSQVRQREIAPAPSSGKAPKKL